MTVIISAGCWIWKDVIVVPGTLVGHVKIYKLYREYIADDKVIYRLIIESDKASAYKIQYALLTYYLACADQKLYNHKAADVLRQYGLHLPRPYSLPGSVDGAWPESSGHILSCCLCA